MREYEYSLPNGAIQKVRIEKIKLRKDLSRTLDEVLRRDNRADFKLGALNNVLYLINRI